MPTITPMEQLKLFDDTPDGVGRDSLPTQTGYSDWQLEQDNKPFKGDKVLWQGKRAIVLEVYKTGRASIAIGKNLLGVPISELTVLADTVVKAEESADIMPLCRESVPEAVRDVQRLTEVESRSQTINKRLINYQKQLTEAKSQKARNKIQRNIDECYEQLDYVGRGYCLPTEKSEPKPQIELKIGQKFYLKSDGRAVFIEKIWVNRAKVCDRSTFDSFNVNIEDLTDKSCQVEIPPEKPQVVEVVGRQNLLPTKDVGRQNLLPTDFYSAIDSWDLSSLYQAKAYIEFQLQKRSQNSCRETEDSLPTENQNDVGRDDNEDSLPTNENNFPHPYIEFKKLPYPTKTKGVRYRKAYYLRDHHNKGKSKYLCSKRENIPEHLRELKIYGEDEIPF